MIAPAPPSRHLDVERSDQADGISIRSESEDVKAGFIYQTIAYHPTLALAAATAVGLTLGWLVKRKWR